MTTRELIAAALEEYHMTLRAYGHIETGQLLDGIVQYMQEYYDATPEQLQAINKAITTEHINSYKGRKKPCVQTRH